MKPASPSPTSGQSSSSWLWWARDSCDKAEVSRVWFTTREGALLAHNLDDGDTLLTSERPESTAQCVGVSCMLKPLGLAALARHDDDGLGTALFGRVELAQKRGDYVLS